MKTRTSTKRRTIRSASAPERKKRRRIDNGYDECLSNCSGEALSSSTRSSRSICQNSSMTRSSSLFPIKEFPLPSTTAAPTIASSREEMRHNPNTPAPRRSPCITSYLPETVVSKCFFSGYLDTFSILLLSSRISKNLSRIARDSVKLLDLRSCRNLPCKEQTSDTMMFHGITRRFPNLSVLDLQYCSLDFDDDMVSQLSHLDKLEVLRLRGCGVTDLGLGKFFRNGGGGTRLKELDVSAIKRNGSALIGNEGLHVISKNCPHLQSLQVGYCARISDAGIEGLTKFCTKLVYLDLSLTSISSGSCKFLRTLPCLRVLDVSATAVCDEGIEYLVGKDAVPTTSSPPPLKELRLRHVHALTVLSLETLVRSREVFQTLDILHLGHCEGLQKITEQQPLYSLHFRRFKNAMRDLKRGGIGVVMG